MRVAVNGFGRIGRLITRAFIEQRSRWPRIELVAINSTAPHEQSLHMLKYDTCHGTMTTHMHSDSNAFTFHEGEQTLQMALLGERDPTKLLWRDLSVDMVLECSGKFNSKDLALAHVASGARCVLVSAPAKKADLTTVYGVNHTEFRAAMRVISNASCTTNCLAPLVQILDNSFGIKNGFATTIHSITNDQITVDARHKDWRRGRAAAQNLIPTSTGAAQAVGVVLPHLAGKIDGAAIRVPTINVSIVDFVFQTNQPMNDTTLLQEIDKQIAIYPYSDVIVAIDEPLVSSDFMTSIQSCIIDKQECRVLDSHTARAMAWYDNEWAFAFRMLDMAHYISEQM